MKFHTLSKEEEHVLVAKGTERAGTGIYDRHFDSGIYVCRRCDAPLYISSYKFDSHCGWPSFDDELPFAIEKKVDRDGHRMEILCKACLSHLGHVFFGEGHTKKNIRHCVNSVSLRFIPAFTKEGYEKTLLAGGCFWGVEYWMQKIPGVISVLSGYTGGNWPYPSYEEVCSKKTGHVEAVEICFDPSSVDFETVLKEFLEIHDPTQVGGQGPDMGDQYRSAIFYLTERQKEIAEKLLQELRKKGFQTTTEVLPARPFYPAEDYHQRYYQKTEKTPYCHKKVKRF